MQSNKKFTSTDHQKVQGDMKSTKNINGADPFMSSTCLNDSFSEINDFSNELLSLSGIQAVTDHRSVVF